MPDKVSIVELIASRHPNYESDVMRRHRLTYERRDEFVTTYLRRHFEEDPAAWRDRKAITYNPSFAAEAVDEYVRAIVQRSPDIHRVGGQPLYREICEGQHRGIDRQGKTMNAFMAKYVVPELLAMGRIGIYVDNDAELGTTLADQGERHPYAYVYTAENILNWRYDPDNPNQLSAVLLRDQIEDLSNFGLARGFKSRYRLVMRTEEGVKITIFDEKGTVLKAISQRTEFPFVLASLQHSLLKVTSLIQITLLNLCSSDTYYAWASNFPIYTEQFDPIAWDRLKETRTGEEDVEPPAPIAPADIEGSLESQEVLSALPPGPATGEQTKIKVGTMHGRMYPLNAERPGFVHPSPEPLEASMKKEEQLKREIRQLTALAITQLEPQRQASAESRAFDNLGLEAGMAFIAQELETIENRLSRVFHSYNKTKPKATTVKYPQKFSLKSDKDRRDEATQLKELHQAVPSSQYTTMVSKAIATTLFKDKISPEDLAKMHKEIEDSKVPTADPDILRTDHEAGLVSDETASVGRGYDPKEYKQAQKDHANRLERIAEAQGDPANRGLGDLSANPAAPGREKEGSQDGNQDKGGRGPAKGAQ